MKRDLACEAPLGKFACEEALDLACEEAVNELAYDEALYCEEA